MTTEDGVFEFDISPQVDQTHEFIEIANDFTNPLELVREAISNSYDAKAANITVRLDVPVIAGERMLRISIEDDGDGMDRDGLQAFFDLGNSPRRDTSGSGNTSFIGEKGHGTKVYFKSDHVKVVTSKGGSAPEYEATLEKPMRYLYEGTMPPVRAIERPGSGQHGTSIQIVGFNNNRRELFSHGQLRDYLMWFTRFGSLQAELTDEPDNTVLTFRGLGADHDEVMTAGHIFPQVSANTNDLFDRHGVRAPAFFAGRWRKSGTLPNFPEITYQASFWVEGDSIKRQYNPMLRAPGRPPQEGCYTVQERYGLWLCKDFIPVDKKNEWITYRGQEYTRFHAFFNCQGFNLTANRGSVANTPREILADAEDVCRRFFQDIVVSDEWDVLEWLEEEAAGYISAEKERTSLKNRLDYLKRAKRAEYKRMVFVEPRQESGVYSIFLVLQTLDPDLFPFRILDYDTHQGLDVIAVPADTTSLAETEHRYVEFKHRLSGGFNHTFDHLHAVICWDLDCNVGSEVTDPSRRSRILTKVQGGNDQHTRYFLDDSRSARRIEVIVLSQFLQERIGLNFA